MAMEQVKTECYPIAILPGLSRLFLDFAERRDALAPFYPASAYSTQWMTSAAVLPPAHRATLCDLAGAAEPRFRRDGPGLSRTSRGCATARARWSPASR